jgi:hypothetical protein
MYKILSYNQWVKVSHDLPNELSNAKNHIGNLIREINKPQVFHERLDKLIELKESCEKLLNTDATRSTSSINDLYNQSIGLLSITLNSVHLSDLNRRIEERKAIRLIDAYHTPGMEPRSEKIAAQGAKGFKQRRLVAQLAQLKRGEFKLETAVERNRNALHKARQQSRSAHDEFAKAWREDSARESPEQYFGTIERESFRAIPANGLLHKINLQGVGDDCSFSYSPFHTKDSGHPMWKGRIIYVLGTRGELFIYPALVPEQEGSIWNKPTHHTSAFSGKAIICGGALETDKNGMIKWIDESSAHYKPTAKQMLIALKRLREQGVLYKNTEVFITQGHKEKAHTLSMHDWNIPFYHLKSAQDEVQGCFGPLKANDKHPLSPVKNILNTIEQCQSVEDITIYFYARYSGLSNPLSELGKALQSSLCLLLNINAKDNNNNVSFKKVVEDRIKLLVKPNRSFQELAILQKLSTFTANAEDDLTSFKYRFLSSQSEEKMILYARDAIACLVRRVPLPDYSASPYNISKKQWQKSEVGNLLREFIQKQQTESIISSDKKILGELGGAETSVTTENKSDAKGKSRVIDLPNMAPSFMSGAATEKTGDSKPDPKETSQPQSTLRPH